MQACAASVTISIGVIYSVSRGTSLSPPLTQSFPAQNLENKMDTWWIQGCSLKKYIKKMIASFSKAMPEHILNSTAASRASSC